MVYRTMLPKAESELVWAAVTSKNTNTRSTVSSRLTITVHRSLTQPKLMSQEPPLTGFDNNTYL